MLHTYVLYYYILQFYINISSEHVMISLIGNIPFKMNYSENIRIVYCHSSEFTNGDISMPEVNRHVINGPDGKSPFTLFKLQVCQSI